MNQINYDSRGNRPLWAPVPISIDSWSSGSNSHLYSPAMDFVFCFPRPESRLRLELRIKGGVAEVPTLEASDTEEMCAGVQGSRYAGRYASRPVS